MGKRVRRYRPGRVSCLALAFACVAAATGKPAVTRAGAGTYERAAVRGTATRCERTALPSNAVFEATLVDTLWTLTRLGDMPAEPGAGGREVSMTLAGEGGRVYGFSGCNRFTGGYKLEGKSVVFKEMAATRMACTEGMEQEAAFLKALESAASWEIRGERLELFDAGGATLLRFESGAVSSSKGPHPAR